MTMTIPQLDHIIRQPTVWPERLRTVERDGRLLGVLTCRAIEYGMGQEWRIRWVRGAEGWVSGDGTTYPDAERAAAALAAMADAPPEPTIAAEPEPVAKSVKRRAKQATPATAIVCER